MQPLNVGRFVQKIKASPHVFIFLDYDGTLSPIAPTPGQAKMNGELRTILRKLAHRPKFLVAVISGRRLSAIKSIFRIKNMIYGGNHGLELEGPGIRFIHEKAKGNSKVWRQIKHALAPLQNSYFGTFLEYKNFTFTYHYRLLEPGKVKELTSELKRRISPWITVKMIRLRAAKKALEILPNLSWNKGKAVLKLLKLKKKPLPIYIGDDVTDESAFRVLKRIGITIRVGRKSSSHAQFYLNDTEEVAKLLELITK